MKTINIRKINTKYGSTMILLVIIIAVIMALGSSLMSVSMMHFKIKKNNTEIIKSFYISEKGINTSFSQVYDIIVDAVVDSVDKAEEYLLIYPLNISEASNIFSDNFKLFVVNEIEEKITNYDNPKIEITNLETLVFLDDILIAKIKSKYISNTNVESTIMADIKIVVPNYYLIDSITLSSLVSLDNWKVK